MPQADPLTGAATAAPSATRSPSRWWARATATAGGVSGEAERQPPPTPIRKRARFGSSRGKQSCVTGRRRTAVRRGSAATAAPRSSAATTATTIPSASAWARSTAIPGCDPPPGRSSPMPRPGSQSQTTACPGTPGADTPGPEKAAARAQRRFLLSRARANAITRQSTLTRAPEWKAGAGCNLVGTEVLLIEAFDA
jgi:hypothetical protein